MRLRASSPVFGTEGAHATRRARHRSSRVLFLLLMGGAAASACATLTLALPRLGLHRLSESAVRILGAVVTLLLAGGALWQHLLLRASDVENFVLQRTVDSLRRRGAYEESHANVMARISDLIEVFTRTRKL